MEQVLQMLELVSHILELAAAPGGRYSRGWLAHTCRVSKLWCSAAESILYRHLDVNISLEQCATFGPFSLIIDDEQRLGLVQTVQLLGDGNEPSMAAKCCLSNRQDFAAFIAMHARAEPEHRCRVAQLTGLFVLDKLPNLRHFKAINGFLEGEWPTRALTAPSSNLVTSISLLKGYESTALTYFLSCLPHLTHLKLKVVDTQYSWEGVPARLELKHLSIEIFAWCRGPVVSEEHLLLHELLKRTAASLENLTLAIFSHENLMMLAEFRMPNLRHLRLFSVYTGVAEGLASVASFPLPTESFEIASVYIDLRSLAVRLLRMVKLRLGRQRWPKRFVVIFNHQNDCTLTDPTPEELSNFNEGIELLSRSMKPLLEVHGCVLELFESVNGEEEKRLIDLA